MGTPPGELDTARLQAIAATDKPLAPHECAERARQVAALIERPWKKYASTLRTGT